jgi:hypothetical protein
MVPLGPRLHRAVQQEDVEMLFALDAQIETLRRQRDDQAAEIIDQMMAGAGVEPGRHSVEITSRHRGRHIVVSLVIDGRTLK